MKIRRTTIGDIYYYHPNHLGSTSFVTDMQQSVVQSFLYAPYGEIISEYNTHVMGEVFPKYTFNAKELDEETGMYYYEARYYAPPVFTSRDAMFEKYFWMSPYAYCANNPVKYVDPTGMEGEVTDLVIADETRGTNYTQKLTTSLSKITGMNITTEKRKGRTFLSYEKDKNGNPIIRTDENGQCVGSETARRMIIDLIDKKDDIVNVSQVKNGDGSSAPLGKNQINLDFSEIEGFIKGVRGGLNPETMGYGMVFLHEFSHTVLGGSLKDNYKGDNPGDVVNKMNQIRSELNALGGNYGQRMAYPCKTIPDGNYIPFDMYSYRRYKEHNDMAPNKGTKFILFQ